jgi:hypothetical protein
MTAQATLIRTRLRYFCPHLQGIVQHSTLAVYKERKGCQLASDGTGPQVQSCPLLTYSCIHGWTGGEEGNISSDPMFVNLDTMPSQPILTITLSWSLARRKPRRPSRQGEPEI